MENIIDSDNSCDTNLMGALELPNKTHPFTFVDLNLEHSKYELSSIQSLHWQNGITRCSLGREIDDPDFPSLIKLYDCRKKLDELYVDNYLYSKKAMRGIRNIVIDFTKEFKQKFPREGFSVGAFVEIQNEVQYNFIDKLKRRVYSYRYPSYNSVCSWHLDASHVFSSRLEYHFTAVLKGSHGTCFYNESYCKSTKFKGNKMLETLNSGAAVERSSLFAPKQRQMSVFDHHCAIHSAPKDKTERLLLQLYAFSSFNRNAYSQHEIHGSFLRI